MKIPYISVIIPVYNDWSRLKKCLSALSKQSYPLDKFEVIVIDNGSNEKVDITGENLSVKLDYCEIPGSYAARNRGLEICNGDIVAFTDSDCLPHPDWINEAVKSFRSSLDVSLIAGHISVFPHCVDHPTTCELYDMLNGFPQEKYVHKSNFGVTANLFVRNKVFKKIGVFDFNLKSGGDKEFCQRAIEHGFLIEFQSKVVVDHPARKSVGEIFKKVKRLTGGKYKRNSGFCNFILFLKILTPPVIAFKSIVLSNKANLLQRIRASSVIFVVWTVELITYMQLFLFRSQEKR